jgi:hypothetical protein
MWWGRKMRKAFRVSLFVVLLLQVSAVNVFVGFGQNPKKNQTDVVTDGLPDIYIDLSPIFQKMGYNRENITSVSNDFINSVFLEYCKNNPYGYETEPPSFFTESMYFSCEDDSVDEYADSENSASSQTIATIEDDESKVCVTCAIWDYAGDSMDLGGWIEDAANFVYDGASDYGDYDLVFTELENEVATHGNITSVLDYFFENYDNVDLYFLGHGGRVFTYYLGYWQWKYFYCTYDSFEADGDFNISNVFWEQELWLYYDSSPMRLVMLTSCWGYGFEYEALYPPGSTNHYRAFAGKTGLGVTSYSYYYLEKWCDLWYKYDWDSSSAAAEAREYAWTESEGAGANMTYGDSGSAIWC